MKITNKNTLEVFNKFNQEEGGLIPNMLMEESASIVTYKFELVILSNQCRFIQTIENVHCFGYETIKGKTFILLSISKY